MIALDGFQFAMAICTGQYARSASLNVLLNQLNRDKGALLLPKGGHAFSIVAALQYFLLTIATTVIIIILRQKCELFG